MISNIISNVLVSLYQTFGISLILAFLFMFLVVYARQHGLKAVFKDWFINFFESKSYRKIFVFSFFTAMLLCRTLLCRKVWVNPLLNVMGIWGIYDLDGNLYTENLENIILFIPFVFLLLWTLEGEIRKKRGFFSLPIILQAVISAFLLSGSIEFCQLFMKLGTFQLSDWFFNTLGGMIGGICYWVIFKWKYTRNSK